MNRTKIFLYCSLAVWLFGSAPAAAQSSQERHTLESEILAGTGVETSRLVVVDLPEDYETSGLDYPVVYFLQGFTEQAPRISNIEPVVESLIKTGQIRPVIWVRPSMWRRQNQGRRFVPLEEFFIREVVPFIDANYRTIPKREARTVVGWSMGGRDAFATALTRPDLFSLVGSYAGSNLFHTNPLLLGHDQHLHPMQFWLWWGTDDNDVPRPTRVLNTLADFNWSHIYNEVEGGTHGGYPAPMARSLRHFVPQMWNDHLVKAFGLRSMTRRLSIQIGDAAVPVDLEVTLQAPTESPPEIHVDLSSVGQEELFRLDYHGDGRYSGQPQIVPPTKNGIYSLPLTRTLANDSTPQNFASIDLRVVPAGDLSIFDQALAPDWTQDLNRRLVATPAAFDGREAWQLDGSGAWRITLAPDAPLSHQGYEALALAFHPAAYTVDEGRAPQLRAASQAGTMDLLQRVDLDNQAWQEVVIPLEELGLETGQDLLELRFNGNIEGTFYLGGLRLLRQDFSPQPEIETFSLTPRFAGGTERIDWIENNLGTTAEIEIRLDAPIGSPARLYLDGSAVGLEESIALEERGEQRYTASLPIAPSLGPGRYPLPISLSMADEPPHLFCLATPACLPPCGTAPLHRRCPPPFFYLFRSPHRPKSPSARKGLVGAEQFGRAAQTDE